MPSHFSMGKRGPLAALAAADAGGLPSVAAFFHKQKLSRAGRPKGSKSKRRGRKPQQAGTVDETPAPKKQRLPMAVPGSQSYVGAPATAGKPKADVPKQDGLAIPLTAGP